MENTRGWRVKSCAPGIPWQPSAASWGNQHQKKTPRKGTLNDLVRRNGGVGEGRPLPELKLSRAAR
jgi:hypothetical protein